MLAAMSVIIGIGKEVPAVQDAWGCGLKNSLDGPWAVRRESRGFRESRYFSMLAGSIRTLGFLVVGAKRPVGIVVRGRSGGRSRGWAC